MEHFQDTAWADYARGVTPDGQTAAMAAHLAEGCDRCERTARALAAMVRCAVAETEQAPPDYVVHNARAIFALHQPDLVRVPSWLIGSLVFDSFRSPMLVGVRSGQQISRQVLYEAGPYWIDIRLDHERGSRRVWLTGQIATAEPAHRIDGLTVSLTVAGKLAAQAHTNSAGEFQLEYEPHRQLQLSIGGPHDEQIELPMLPYNNESNGSDGVGS